MKKILIFALLAALLISVCGCVKMKTLVCDGCQKEVQVAESSNMTDEWIIYCEECNEKFFGDDPLFGGK
ncbi:MAG: hypothetical protein IKU84_03190 [Clostridia bacterium]|nr:hypothetical protein [Clostridia bacterium]